MNGTCKAYVVHCGDPRIQASIQKLVWSIGLKLGDYFPVSVKGGAGNLEQVREHLALAAEAHHPEFVVLITHEDCKAGACQHHLYAAREIAKRFGFRSMLYHVPLVGEPILVE